MKNSFARMGQAAAVLLAAALLPAVPAAAAGIYKWIDAQGRVHFTDQPPDAAAAERLRVKVNTYSGPPLSLHAPAPPATAATATTPATRARVRLYGTSWCGVCRHARQWLASHNVPFDDYDIETSAQAQSEYLAAGVEGVPLIVVGRRGMLGFSEADMMQLLAAAGDR